MVYDCGGTPQQPDKPKPLTHPEQVLNIAMDELLKTIAGERIRQPNVDQDKTTAAVQLMLEMLPYRLTYDSLNPAIQGKLITTAGYVILFQRAVMTSKSSLVTDFQAFWQELVRFNDLKIKGLRGNNPLDVSQWATQGPALRRSLRAKKNVFLNGLSQLR